MMDFSSDLILVTPDVFPNRGGVARYLNLLSNYFSSRIRVVSDGLLFKFFWPHWLKTTLLLMRNKRTYRYVITSHVLPFGTAAYVAGRFTKKPYVVIVHGMDIRLAIRSKKSLTSRVLSNAYLVVANSNALAQELQQEFRLKNILTIYPSVDPTFAASVTKIASDTFRLLSVSRLIDRKGHERVLQALALLKLNESLPKFRYTIVGDGPIRQTLETLAIELELESHVVFKGDISDIELQTAYNDADVFILPVKNDSIDKEGFGMVYLEAAAHGVPSIATRISGVDEAVLDRETGLLVEDGDIEALASAIFSLADDASLRQQLGESARKRAITEFTPSAQFSKLEPYLV